MGIKEGGRTGLVAVTVSACFGVSIFFAPILQVGGGRGGGKLKDGIEIELEG